MSQAGANNSGSPPPPGTVLKLTPDSGAAVVSDGSGNINLTGIDPGSLPNTTTSSNLITYNDGANTMLFDFRYQGKTTTSDGAGQTQIVVSIPVTAGGVITALALVTGIEASDANAVGGQNTAVVYRAGGGATLLTTGDLLIGTTTPIVGATFVITTSGNNLIVQVTGVATFTIEWSCVVIISQKTFI
jgi:hypothetical protein